MVTLTISEKKQKEIYEAFELNRQIVARMPEFTYEIGDEGRKVTFIRDQDEECTCLPDLPDGRINGGRGHVCPACAAEYQDSDEIPF